MDRSYGNSQDLIEKGIINFDFIKARALLGLILIETKSVEELSNIWNPDYIKHFFCKECAKK
jgi:hypothetical protein